jgi:hypothetical protein
MIFGLIIHFASDVLFLAHLITYLIDKFREKLKEMKIDLIK